MALRCYTLTMYDDETSLTDFLVAFLSSGKSSYRFHQILRERKMKQHSEATIRTTLHRLTQKGIVIKNKDGWHTSSDMTPKKNDYLPANKISSAHKILVSFDVPESHKYSRDWLRKQLKIFGFTMIQKSLWKGPGPLPKEFGEYLTRHGIKKCIKIFHLKQ